MIRYLRLLRIFLANALQLELEYRVNLLLNAFNAALVLGAGLFVLQVMFGQARAIGGWSFDEALAPFGVFMIFESLVGLLLKPNLNRLPEYIRTGSLDFMLLKPVSGQFLVSFRHTNVWYAPNAVVGLALILYSMAAVDTLRPQNLALLAVMLAAAAAIVYSLWFMLTATAFWLVKVENLSELIRTLLNAGRFPVSAYPGWLRFGFTFVAPIAFVTTVPAAAAVGRLTWEMGLASLGVAAAFLWLGRVVWRQAVASYTSASS